jgi:hypothetical protein
VEPGTLWVEFEAQVIDIPLRIKVIDSVRGIFVNNLKVNRFELVPPLTQGKVVALVVVVGVHYL